MSQPINKEFINSKVIDQQGADSSLPIINDWQIIARDFADQPDSLPEGQLLLPMAYWLQHQDVLSSRPETGIWIDSDEEVEQLADCVDQFAVIGVNFPAFADGRGFSTGHLLKQRYHFKGQLRAIGHVIPDQWFYLKRCGFDAFQLSDGAVDASGFPSQPGFSVTYQGCVENPEPLFRRR